ncbi:hypothetical protein [Pseudomonas aeruginosa]|uniref:hypothetical protein n=1 Tax=Pseudomonas aeruginosa TaxID=287 RepID=UPI0021A978B1|nr:hypothetical protein [Pseudomonas aeruginosa]
MEVMMIGRKRRRAASRRRRAGYALLPEFGELDDENRVLRRKTDDGDQADLEIRRWTYR